MKIPAIFLAALATVQVTAHGGVYNYTIDGVDYPGHYPWWTEEGQVSIQRRFHADPITALEHPMLACNRGYPLQSSNPTKVAKIPAGGRVVATYNPPPCPDNWVLPDEVPFPDLDGGPTWCIWSTWYHYHGPMTVYLADCEGPCHEWDATGKRWFKIWETGYSPTGWPAGSIPRSPITDQRTWQQNNLHKGSIDITIPKNLKPGNYLIRHEVYYSEGDLQLWPQLYPTCANLEIIGDGTEFPSDEYLVSFPGAYKKTDPAFANQGPANKKMRSQTYNYTIPGPKVWSPAS